MTLAITILSIGTYGLYIQKPPDVNVLVIILLDLYVTDAELCYTVNL